MKLNIHERVNGLVLCYCLCADGVSSPVGYAPPEPSRMLEVLSRLPKLKPQITRMARINKNSATEQAG